MKTSDPPVMFDLRLDASHGAGQPPQGDLEAIRPKRTPNLGATDQVANIMRNTAAIVELRASDTESDRPIV